MDWRPVADQASVNGIWITPTPLVYLVTPPPLVGWWGGGGEVFENAQNQIVTDMYLCLLQYQNTQDQVGVQETR